MTHEQLLQTIKELLDMGKIVIGAIQVDDGVNTVKYTSLSACPPEHREGYRRALETVRDVYLCDIVYRPVLFAPEHAKSVATLE